MKYSYIIIYLFLCFSFCVNAQINNCEYAHIGIFKIDSGEYGVTKIERTKKVQLETNEKMGFQAIYDVVWINDCNYELRNKKIIMGQSKYGLNPNDILIVQILKIEEKNIYLRLSSNYSDFITDALIEKID